MFIGNFSNADERSSQARHDYNFVAFGIPDLLLMTRCDHGENATTAVGSNSKECQRDTEVSYTAAERPAEKTSASGSLTPPTVAVSTVTSIRPAPSPTPLSL
jgi:hypothetical protein